MSNEGSERLEINLKDHDNYPTQCVALVEDNKGKKSKIYSLAKNLVVYRKCFFYLLCECCYL